MYSRIKNYIKRAFNPRNKQEDTKIQLQLSTGVLILSVIFVGFSLRSIGYGLLGLAEILYFDPLTQWFTIKGINRFVSMFLSLIILVVTFIVLVVVTGMLFN